MKNRFVQIAAAAVAVGVLAFFATRPAGPSGPAVGTAAPDFHLTDLSGRTVSLADYKGKVVLLDFWATWCPSCEAEIPELKEVDASFKGKDFAVLAASVDEGGPEVVAKYAAEKTLPYRVLFADDSAARAYRVYTLPATFLIGRDGLIARKYVDPPTAETLDADIKTQLERRPS
ncbi:MAG: TlpA family protein disulfide reductase [Elusimicrobia bacterium]|nr:TlpA family protein disulfide reductase [Elusimicrobiota bacterium]